MKQKLNVKTPDVLAPEYAKMALGFGTRQMMSQMYNRQYLNVFTAKVRQAGTDQLTADAMAGAAQLMETAQRLISEHPESYDAVMQLFDAHLQKVTRIIEEWDL